MSIILEIRYTHISRRLMTINPKQIDISPIMHLYATRIGIPIKPKQNDIIPITPYICIILEIFLFYAS